MEDRELYRLTRENNRMLKGMRFRNSLSSLIQIIIYLVFFGAGYFLYQNIIVPVVQSVSEVGSQVSNITTRANSFLGGNTGGSGEKEQQ